jgi:HK97 family phage prohead protease
MVAVAHRSVIDRHARRVMYPSESKLRAKSDDSQSSDSGWLEGYAAVWGNVDAQGEIMQRGCFARSIQQNVPAGKVKLMVRHFCNGGDALDCIGTITQAKEDDFGLWIHAELSSVELAQDIRTLVLEEHVKLLSVGYKPVLWDYSNSAMPKGPDNILVHQECELCEVTVTVRPANPQAAILAAKTEGSPTITTAKPAQSTGASEADKTVAGKTTANVTAPEPSALPRIQREIEMRRAEISLLLD